MLIYFNTHLRAKTRLHGRVLMEQIEQHAPIKPYDSAAEAIADQKVGPSRLAALFAPLVKYRVALVGSLTIILAVVGEMQLRRSSGGGPPFDAELGTRLVQVALLLVGIVSWVNPFSKFRRKRKVGTQEPPIPIPPAEPLPTRPVATWDGRIEARPTAIAPVRRHSSGLWPAYMRTRARLGLTGTLLGLVVVAGLAYWLYLRLQQGFADPLAPWLWVAMLGVLVLTFVGVPAESAPGSLITNDPIEPRTEAPVQPVELFLLSVIMTASVILRLWNLDHIPAGPYPDESDRGIDARHVLLGQSVSTGPYEFFGTAWWAVPTPYFWLVAQSMRLFGDNLAGERMIHAIAGILTVWLTYRIGRVVWSPRVGLVAAALLAVSDFAIQFSRTAGESTISILTWTACFYFLYRGLKTMRPVDFALSGLAGGLTMYGYASGKLLPVFLAAASLYLLVRWGIKGIRRYFPRLALMALTALLTFAPSGLYFWQRQDLFSARFNNVSIFAQGQPILATYHTDNWAVAIFEQLKIVYQAFDIGHELGPFYPTNEPVLPILWAALWLLGSAYLVWRVTDARYAILGIWILSGLAGSALTVGAPTLQRVAGMVPALGLVPALYLDRMASGFGIPKLRLREAWRPRLLRAAANVAIVVLVVALAAQTIPFYFGTYAPKAIYGEYALAGRYAEKLDPAKDKIYESDLPILLGTDSPTLFMANNVSVSEVDLGEEIPIVQDGGKNVHFLTFPSGDPTSGAVHDYYPGGALQQLKRADGSPFIDAYRVSHEEIEAHRHTFVTYRSADGTQVQRVEARLGMAQAVGDGPALSLPPDVTYPVSVEWQGGLIAPAYGLYRFVLKAPADTVLEIDGHTALTVEATSNAPQTTPVALARGTHRVRLQGALTNANSRIELYWGVAGGPTNPVAHQYLWDGVQGDLYGQIYLGQGNNEWMTADSVDMTGTPNVIERRDSILRWANVNRAMDWNTYFLGIWRGTAQVDVAGDYTFDPQGEPAVSVWVDGKLIGASQIPGVAAQLPAKVRLEAGPHTVEFRVQGQRDNSRLAVYWQLPDGTRQLFSTTALAPSDEGAWRPGGQTEPPTLPPHQLALNGAPTRLNVERVIVGSPRWADTRSIGVFADGSVAIGDGTHLGLSVLNPSGDTLAVSGNVTSTDVTTNTYSDVAVDKDGTIAALDQAVGDIQLFKVVGSQLIRGSRFHPGLHNPKGLAWGPDGKIYVADTGASRIVRVDRTGKIEVLATQEDPLDGIHERLEQPLDVAVAPDGAIYVADVRRVRKLDSIGRFVAEYSAPTTNDTLATHLALWNNLVVVSNPLAKSVMLLDSSTGLVSTPQLTGASDFDHPTGVAVDSSGRLYVFDTGNNRIMVLSKR